MGRWNRENDFDDLLESALEDSDVPWLIDAPVSSLALVKAIIARESGFRPEAFNPEEASGGGANPSYGLFQLRRSTAEGLGWRGDPAELWDPALNIRLGVKLVAEHLERFGGNIWDAISAHQWGPRGPIEPGRKWRNPGYVNEVADHLSYFEGRRLRPGPLPPSGPGPRAPEHGPRAAAAPKPAGRSAGGLVGLLLALWALAKRPWTR